MSKRRYTRIKEYESVIVAMREAGKTNREIADELGVELRQIKWWVSRSTTQSWLNKLERVRIGLTRLMVTGGSGSG